MKNTLDNGSSQQNKLPQDGKLYGKPLQELYKKMMAHPKAPKQPEIIRELQIILAQQEITYHPRTLKRQLLGSIKYIPVALEEALIEWVRKNNELPQKALLKQYESSKQDLKASASQDLYVTPKVFTRLAEAYLIHHKNFSRRKLALALQERVQRQKLKIGLETLQAALAGKTRKVRKILEDELVQLFAEDGFDTEVKLQNFLQETQSKGQVANQKVDVGRIGDLVDAYLVNCEGISKRQLALKIKNRLKFNGYAYHLSSIQSVIEGKTKKTRKAILDTLQELLVEAGLEKTPNPKDYISTISESQRQWHHYTSAKEIPSLVDQLLQKYPALTRRQLAQILKEALTHRKFDFSLNTLQYILAGKTQRTRKVVLDLIEGYLKDDHFASKLAKRGTMRQGRPSTAHRVLEAYQKYQHCNDEEEKKLLQENYLNARLDLIRKRSIQKFGRISSSHRNSDSSRGYLRQIDSEDPFALEAGNNTLPDDFGDHHGGRISRLVS